MPENEPDNTQSHAILTKGIVVTHYRIVEKIGAGGMGEVYLADDTNLHRQVALKFMPFYMAADENSRMRFMREARATAKLDHPNIVPIYEVGEFNGRPYFAMAHIEGQTLREVIKNGKLTVSEAVGLAMQICQGLQKAHESGIVHRDVKPGNIIIDSSNRARLLDFGLATIHGEEKMTKTGSTLGTVGYMAPEQILSKNVDKRADIFSVGVILYEMLTGRRPFTGDSDAAVVKAITDSTPEPIARFKSGVTGELQQLIDKALAKDPSHRYQHADGMLADLKRLDVVSEKKRIVRSWWRWAAAAVVLAGAYFTWSQFNVTPPPAEAQPPVIIILPFENLGSEADDYFSDGIRDEINSRLSTVKNLRVISPRSADRYRDFDGSIGQIGQETGADYVLEATIRWDKSGDVDRFRITPRLTKTSDNYMMWSDNYEQKLIQVFEVQSKIADEIVTALGLTLWDSGKAAPDYAPTDNMEAYNYYLRGLDIKNKGIFKTNQSDAILMFDSAVKLDPDFAVAWAEKSMALSNMEFGFVIGDNVQQGIEAREAAEKALELEPGLPIAHIALGWYYNYIERDYEKALGEFDRAYSEINSSAELSDAIGVVKMRQGKWLEALEYFEEAARLDPLTVRRYFWLTVAYSYLRDYKQSNRYLNRGLVLNPEDRDAVFMALLTNLMQTGTVDEPIMSFEEITGKLGVADAVSNEYATSATIGLWRFMIDRVDPDKMIDDLRNLTEEERSPYVVFMNQAQIFELTGREDSARVYYKLAKDYLLKYAKTGSADFHVYAPLGLNYAYLGMADSAVWAGQKAKEFMSIDDCHW